MCGLIAGTGRLEPRRMIALGCLSEKRGSDSAGVAWKHGDDVRVAKVAQNPLVAFPVTLAPAIRGAVRQGGPIIGHTRAATTGEVTNKNAHPFLMEGIVFAHNGIITNYRRFGNYDVDSQCLIRGIKEKNFSEFFGPIALVWIEDGKLHAFRKGNPLYRGVRRRAVYLASESEMLGAIGCTRIKELAEAHMYVFNGTKLESSKSLPANKTFTSYYQQGTYYADGWRDHWDEKTKTWVKSDDDTQRSGSGCGSSSFAGFGPERRLSAPRMTYGEIMRQAEEEAEEALPKGEAEAEGEPDTLAEADAQRVPLEDIPAHNLCTECLLEEKAFGRDFCEKCFKKLLEVQEGYGL